MMEFGMKHVFMNQSRLMILTRLKKKRLRNPLKKENKKEGKLL